MANTDVLASHVDAKRTIGTKAAAEDLLRESRQVYIVAVYVSLQTTAIIKDVQRELIGKEQRFAPRIGSTVKVEADLIATDTEGTGQK